MVASAHRGALRLGLTDRASQRLAFLSPEWVQEVIAAANAARQEDLHFRVLTESFSFSLVYTIDNIPKELRKCYGGSGQVVVHAELRRGEVRRIEVGGKMPARPASLRVASDYQLARKLLLGKTGPLAPFFSGKLKVEAATSFRKWPELVTKAVLACRVFLRFARDVPTVFL